MLAFVAGGVRVFSPSSGARHHSRVALRPLTAAEPVDEPDGDLQAPAALAVTAGRPVVAYAPTAARLLATHSQEAPRRVVRRMKMPPPHDDGVPPY